tara:strand:- start:12391 stop:13500 length:1110 start_codon:yes stop_codon:yes gene_type:complete
MTQQWILPDAVFDGARLHSDMGVLTDGSHILDLAYDIPKDAIARRETGIISPGFVDLQVNGGGGILLNQTPTSAGMQAIAKAHRRFGTVAILPTVITDKPYILAQVVEAAIATHGAQGIAGLHIEGPHISVARRGTHAAEFIRPLDDGTIAHVARLRSAGIAVMITVAPEAATPVQIGQLCALGAVVSLGHSDSTSETTNQFLAAGATCFTHLFNAMSQMKNRAPGVVGAAINSDAYAGFICDGIHVADEMLRLALRARPIVDRMFLVSDAMPTVGGPDSFKIYGQTISLHDGQLRNQEGSLAGAHVTQLEGVARLVGKIGIAPEAALRMAITVPARLMGLDHLATLKGRALDDVLLLDAPFETARFLR